MMRDALVFPTSLTPEEKKFKEMQENLKNLKKRLEATSGCPNEQIEKERKRKIEEAASNTEELKRKIASGVFSLNKVGEKREFKRSKGVERRLSHDRKDSVSSQDGLLSPPIRPDPPKKEPRPSPMVYVRGIELNEELLERLFTPFGVVRGCEIDSRKRTGFVWMDSIDEAAQVIEKLDKTGVDHWTLHVSYALYPRPVGSHRRTTSVSSTTSSTASEGLASPPIPSLMAWDAATAKSSERKRIAHSSD
ncbi:hypothetical protein PMAYCL1PPCAC_02038 [Pristionchus mayeri]|uniref:Negative elongation factor E n=1 Tax=Pristionchus mayeri TaxID=1317129 RepID=A0AAN4Z4N2_9BILA|nr:hypothetical protein PMAYCL1PPCAC_02038 [Pristionchus mayeri]